MGFALSTLQLRSPAFDHCTMMPARCTAEGTNVSPALVFSGVPADARALAVVCHDPDAPLVTGGGYGFVHWVLYNLPVGLRGLDEGTRLGTGGLNDFGETDYGGPMPPVGHGVHHYYFWALALSLDVRMPPGLSLTEFLAEVEPLIIGMNRLIGTYERRSSASVAAGRV